MTRIVFDLRKTIEENAQRSFEAAKKARRKIVGAERTIVEWKLRAQAQDASVAPPRTTRRAQRKREWYESFRWCFSSDGFLLVGGRDASTNELLIKRHMEAQDIVFHTDMAGSPFVLLKTEGKEILASSLEEGAQFCASFSRAWKNGLSALEVFRVAPEQVSKEANTGEYLPKGAFVIRGRTLYHKPLLKVAIGIDKEGRVQSGPPNAIAANTTRSLELFQGNDRASDVAKSLAREFGSEIALDELIAALPPGGSRLGRRRLAHSNLI